MNIPVDANGYDPAKHGNGGENVIDAIERFLVHFVGDLHQPLHCADRNGDKGGNGRLVFFPGRKGKQSVAEYGDALNTRVTEKQAKAWAQGTPREWAVECWKVARDVVYKDIRQAGDPPVITEDYIAKAQPVVDEQIQKAGVRLAAALNLAFG